jgi:hypothetical protein
VLVARRDRARRARRVAWANWLGNGAAPPSRALLQASTPARASQGARVMRNHLLPFLAGASVVLSSSAALAQVRPDAWFVEIDGDYGSVVSDVDGSTSHDQLSDDVSDGGVITYGTRDDAVCQNWRHDTVAPYMGSQFYSVACAPGDSERSEQMLVNHWYPGTDSQRTLSFAMRVRDVDDTVPGGGFFMQFHQDGGHPPPFRLKWSSDGAGNLSVEGGVRWDRLVDGAVAGEYATVFEAPIERDEWQRFMVQIDLGPAAGAGICPGGPGSFGSITVWKMDNASGDWLQPTPTYRGQVGFRYRKDSPICLTGTELSYQFKVGQYVVAKDNTLDFDNVSYGKRWNNITKNRLIGYKKSVLRLPFEEISGAAVDDRSWTWNDGVAGDPTRDYGNDGAIVGTVRRNSYGVNGRSLRFDGVSNYVTVPIDPTDFDVGNYLTVSTWFRTTARPTTNRGLVMIDEYGSTWKTLLYASDSSVSFGVKHPAGEYSRLDHLVPAGRYADNQWHHVVGTFNRFAADGQRIKLYIDGVKVLESAGDDLPVLRGDNRLVIGKFSTSNFFQGDIDDVGLFNYAMTEDDVENLWLERGAP